MKRSKKFITAVLTVILVLTANVFTFAISDSELAGLFDGLGIQDTGLLVEHLQTINLSESELEELVEKMEQLEAVSSEVESASEYPREALLEMATLTLEVAHILQLDFTFTDRDGNPINLTDIIAQDDLMLDFLVVITDSDGNFLATIDPATIDIPELDSITQETTEAVEVVKETAQVVEDTQENTSVEFQPETGGRLPDTATPYANYIIVGASLMAFSALGLFAARKRQTA